MQPLPFLVRLGLGRRPRLAQSHEPGILGLGLCVALGAVFVGGIFALTRPVVDASEQFLALLGQGRIADAYESLPNR